MNKKHLSAFTLVELIIVITILAILATIAFVSFQNYTKDARDSHRLATLKNIENGLNSFSTTTGNFPLPDDSFTISASGTNIMYQGYIGEQSSKLIKLSKTPVDPYEDLKYSYSTNINKTKYQLLGYFENKSVSSIQPKTYATDFLQKGIKVYGNNIGIITNEDNSPFTSTGIDIVNYNGVPLKSFISNSASGIITGTGNVLRKMVPAVIGNIYKSCYDILQNNSYTKYIDETYTISPNQLPINVRCDMTYDGGGWTEVFYSTSGSLARTSIDNEDLGTSPDGTYSLLWSMRNIKNNGVYEFKLENDQGIYNHFTQTNAYHENPINNNYTKKTGTFVFYNASAWYGLGLGSFGGNTNIQTRCTLATSYQGGSRRNCFQDQDGTFWMGPWNHSTGGSQFWVRILQR